jgi:hypothetical protein
MLNTEFATPQFDSAAWQNHVVYREILLARLERRAAILTLIRRKREETGSQSLGENIQRLIVEQELSELDGARPRQQFSSGYA